MIRLKQLHDEKLLFETNADCIRIGRSENSDFRLLAAHISLEHAIILFGGSRWLLRDNQSTNGTLVQREGKILDVTTIKGREIEILDQDILLLGERNSPVQIKIELVDERETNVVSTRSVQEIHEAEIQAQSDHKVLNSLYEAQKAISYMTELDDILDAVSLRIFNFLEKATHVTVALREDDGDRPEAYIPIGSRVREHTDRVEQVPLTRSVLKRVIQSRAAVLAADARHDVDVTASLLAADIVSAIGIPLWDGNEILGVLQVDNRAKPGMFKEHDLDRVALLAQSAGQAFARGLLLRRLRRAEERSRTENVYLKQREEHRRFEGMIGESSAMVRLVDQLHKVAETRVSVLVLGDTGTGKELVASAVHYWSSRRDRLFVAQNCAALPENLLESELFGHKKGAFTGATDEKKGLFELAHEGTLFLDEIGEMPASLQAKLLRVLQEGEIRPVGSNITRKVDVRIVAATNRQLTEEVRAGRFREDLFYRLNVFPIQLPSLKERREDIPLLAGYFLERYGREFGRIPAGFSQQVMELLQEYDWPGNVRELQNEVQRLIIQVEDGHFVQPEDLSPVIRRAENVLARVRPEKGTLKEMVEQVEKWILSEALREHQQNKSATAKTLGITREGLHKKLRSYGMS